MLEFEATQRLHLNTILPCPLCVCVSLHLSHSLSESFLSLPLASSFYRSTLIRTSCCCPVICSAVGLQHPQDKVSSWHEFRGCSWPSPSPFHTHYPPQAPCHCSQRRRTRAMLSGLYSRSTTQSLFLDLNVELAPASTSISSLWAWNTCPSCLLGKSSPAEGEAFFMSLGSWRGLWRQWPHITMRSPYVFLYRTVMEWCPTWFSQPSTDTNEGWRLVNTYYVSVPILADLLLF